MYTNTVVVQLHSVVMTKTDKIYKVRCTYDTASKNITFGMMPIRDPDMISITSAPEAPAPRISILNPRGQEVRNYWEFPLPPDTRKASTKIACLGATPRWYAVVDVDLTGGFLMDTSKTVTIFDWSLFI